MKEKIKTTSPPSIREIGITDILYPASLRSLDKKAPGKLYCIGDISLLNRRSVAVVGARKASQYGKWAAYHLGRKLADYDIVTVSGLAMGCDLEAHKGALDAGGPTIAVLGSGPDVCYPEPNRPIYEKICQNGLIVSEYPPGTRPYRSNFPMRNRIISGLSEITVVAEASLSSGSLITAGHAAEQGRGVMALPANISGVMSIGCNKLIQDGVTPLIKIDDVITALGISLTIDRELVEKRLGVDERAVYKVVEKNGECTAETVAAETGLGIAKVNGVVSILEIKGVLTTSLGKIGLAK